MAEEDAIDALSALVPATLGQGHVLWDIGLFFSQLAIVTFGGAYAVLAYMAQEAVQGFGWLRAGEMADGLGLAETTPGPLILVTQFVGFLAAYRDAAPFTPFVTERVWQDMVRQLVAGNEAVCRTARKVLKTADGAFLWQPGLLEGQPARVALVGQHEIEHRGCLHHVEITASVGDGGIAQLQRQPQPGHAGVHRHLARYEPGEHASSGVFVGHSQHIMCYQHLSVHTISGADSNNRNRNAFCNFLGQFCGNFF